MLILDKNYYKNLLIKADKLLSNLPNDLSIKRDSWTLKARDNIDNLIKIHEITDKWADTIGVQPIPTEKQLYEMTSSILELDNLCDILENRTQLVGKNLKEYTSKIKTILKMPLTVNEETIDSSKSTYGRNTLFELLLFLKFLNAGYSVELGDNPDLIINVNKKKYAIECKRIFKAETYISNIYAGIGGLKDHGLDKLGTLGIIAIDYSRYFYGTYKEIHGNSEIELKSKFEELESEFVTNTKKEFFNIDFPFKIPFLFLNHRNFGYVKNIPYSYSHLMIEQTNYQSIAHKTLLNDFNMLIKSINEK